MTPRQDPYRVLGLVPGATAGEVRSAYRRLAKLNHPDTAGERSLPRFLAIKAAYEELVDGEGRLRSRGWPGGGVRASRPSGTPANAASRDAWRARRASASAPHGDTAGDGHPSGSGTSSTTGASSRGRGGGRRADDAGGATSDGAGAGRPRRKPGTGEQRTGTGERRAGTGAGTGGGSTATGGRRPRTSERRTARPGSTTYDEATQPLDPSWEGGAWYGASSGSYWTLNPREYADPRKHGPEYQERAKRAAQLDAARRAGTPAGANDGDPSSSWASPTGSTPRDPLPGDGPSGPLPRYRRVARRPGPPDGP